MARIQPFNSKFFNGIEIFNEVCLIIGSLTLIEFSDYELDLDFRYKVGWFMTALMGLNTIVNIFGLFFKIGSVIKEIISKKCE